ncbi:hypothetical protein [Rhodospirillum sp. A1_3_36]|uniref:hypothetical protein n=1 Tax=Rhodospirillum sp. A1_3_36 TaxID=3391666 RepID=UPI0039A49B3D
MSVTPKVTGTTTSFSAVTNTRYGDGLRATSASESFSPILETGASAHVGPQDEGLRNDEWGTGDGQGRGRPIVPLGEEPIRIGRIKTSNAFSQVLFAEQSHAAMRGMGTVPKASERGTSIYEANMRVIAARFTGEKLVGGTLNRYY